MLAREFHSSVLIGLNEVLKGMCVGPGIAELERYISLKGCVLAPGKFTVCFEGFKKL